MSRQAQAKTYSLDEYIDHSRESESPLYLRMVESFEDSFQQPEIMAIEDDLHCIGPFSPTAD